MEGTYPETLTFLMCSKSKIVTSKSSKQIINSAKVNMYVVVHFSLNSKFAVEKVFI